jgi:hypothetical protein
LVIEQPWMPFSGLRNWWRFTMAPKLRRPWRVPRPLPPGRYRPLLESLEQRLAPTVTLSVSNPGPFPEGDTGTTNMMFVVTRSGDLAPAVRADYTTQDGTAVAGTDYVATSGTLFFASNQLTATIAVPIIGNTILQSNRSFTVSLSNPVSSAPFALQQSFATGQAGSRLERLISSQAYCL